MKVALVHDYLSEYGGAERVLESLVEMFPDAPIYTAFKIEESTAGKYFKNTEVKESFLAPILKWKKLYSPLRFLAPLVWESFDFSDYDLVISSASWYITKGIKTEGKTKHLCYLHTPPRYLYGYKTAIEWQRYWLVKIYAKLVNGFLRRYDFWAAQKPDLIASNSENVKERCKKLYKRESEVIYPPVKVEEIIKKTREIQKEDYFLIVSRVVGSKGIDMAMKAAIELGFKLKIVGEKAGLLWEESKIENLKENNIEFLGRIEDEELWQVYARAKGFLALAYDEDFGMTVVEAQAAGTPVLAYFGGGYKETIIENKTGIFFRKYELKNLIETIKNFEKKKFDRKELERNARKFSREIFKEKILGAIQKLGVRNIYK